MEHCGHMKDRNVKPNNKNALIKARCREDLKRDIALVAQLQDMDESDIVRTALREYVSRWRGQTQRQPLQLNAA